LPGALRSKSGLLIMCIELHFGGFSGSAESLVKGIFINALRIVRLLAGGMHFSVRLLAEANDRSAT